MLEIVSPLTGEKLIIAENDFEKVIGWQQAKRACANLGYGWRLPTLSELHLMHKEFYEKGIGNFKSEDYWSNLEGDDGFAWINKFSDESDWEKPLKDDSYARAVRAI